MHYLYLIVTLFFFSSLEVVTKPLSGRIDPFFLTFFRFFAGGIFLTLFSLTSRKKIERNDLSKLIAVGCLNGVISMSLLQLSIKHSNASTAATLVAMNPLFVSVFAHAFGKDKLTRKAILAISLGAIGVLVLSSANVAGDSPFGIFCGIAASITFALYTVLMRDFSVKYGALLATSISTLAAGLVYGALLAVFGRLSVPSLSWPDWSILLYVGIGITGVAYVTFFKAMQRFGPVRTSLVFYLKPALASFLAAIFLSETISAQKVLGTIIVVLSLFLR
ncbi:DMT family transporter [Pseudothermotoga sp.]|nr:DMT family transporter [Pseudothermotoga sp.]MCX7813347.1 DMT family transporter [Pseudothermotoga sp.]MDW8139665.1 DMT family transporter [Pseudothermotoga sp.]